MKLEKYSFGVGDRFAHQAGAQLKAFQIAADNGLEIIPVWNKSNREHTFVGSEPASVYAAARQAVEQAGWQKNWHVDADHIQLATVEKFLDCSDFFTIDVADYIGKPTESTAVEQFVKKHPELVEPCELPGRDKQIHVSADFVTHVISKYLVAIQEAGKIFRHIANHRGADNLIPEVSMDETDLPQSPAELFIILAGLADEQLPLQTIAPKFTGRFNKGVDYVGDLDQFRQEYADDVAVIQLAIERYGLPENLKLSVHSGSDKFQLYPVIQEIMQQTGAGIHIKTAGTTWLEELIGLSEAGGDGLELTKEIYGYAHDHVQELCAPYASVIDIDPAQLPTKATVSGWNGAEMASTIRHIQTEPLFNAHVRQLLHVSFKLAAKAGWRYTDLLKSNSEIVGKNVTENIWSRHMQPLFLG